MIIMKFGGTSVKDMDAMRKVIQIVSRYKNQKPMIVLSACAGITDKLLDLVTCSPKNSPAQNNKILNAVEQQHIKIIEKLIENKILKVQAIADLTKKINELKRLIEGVKLLKECTQRNTAQALAYGELLSSTILYYLLLSKGFKAIFLDARELMKTDSNYLNAEVDFRQVNKNLSKLKRISKSCDFFVTQGFIGSDSKGITSTLGRGGSDYSASIFGAAVKADEIQIWTDVSGVLTTDPRIIKSAKSIKEISFDEMRELAFYGAKVLHPDTIIPALEKKVPVRILNTYHPNAQGTVIINNSESKIPKLNSVIMKSNCSEINFIIPINVDSQKFFNERLDYLINNSIKILYSVCTESNCRIIFESEPAKTDYIKKSLKLFQFTIRKVNLLCIAGSNLTFDSKGSQTKSGKNFLNSFFDVLNSSNPMQVIFGASSFSIIILTRPENGLSTLDKIHSFIIKNMDK